MGNGAWSWIYHGNRLIENTCNGITCTILPAISTDTQNDMSYESLIDSIDRRNRKDADQPMIFSPPLVLLGFLTPSCLTFPPACPPL